MKSFALMMADGTDEEERRGLLSENGSASESYDEAVYVSDSNNACIEDQMTTTTTDHCHAPLFQKMEDFTTIRTLSIVAGFCGLFILAQFTGGILANSLAIIMDAAHMLSDLFSIILSILMIRLAKYPATREYTFGYLRAEFIGALMSIFIVWIITITMIIFATQRIVSGSMEVEANYMLITSIVGIAFNLIMGLILKCSSKTASLHGHSHRQARTTDSENINIRAAFIHILGDFIQSIGVLFASLVIRTTGFNLVDPLCTYLFSVVVICTSIPVARDIFRTLMEASPQDLHYSEVFEELSQLNGVKCIHDLHIWNLGIDRRVASVHLVIDNQEDAIPVTRSANNLLIRKFNIFYPTVQIEIFESLHTTCCYCKSLPL